LNPERTGIDLFYNEAYANFSSAICGYYLGYKEIRVIPMPQYELDKMIFTSLGILADEKGTCLRRKIAACAIKGDRLIAIGWNGAPSDVKSCRDIGHCHRTIHGIPSGAAATLCRAVHAESRLLTRCAMMGFSIYGATVWCGTRPCVQCTGLLTEAGVAEVRYLGDYPDDLSRIMQEDSPTNFVQVSV
jgi:dCMP deaminase